MKVIPAIDIIDGKCVRLTQGRYDQKKVYNEDPLAVAIAFERAGMTRLHLVDLDGAKAGKVINWNTIQSIATCTSLHIDFGGGVKTEAEIEKLLALSVKQINIGSTAVKQPLLACEWLVRYGGDRILLSADVKNEMIVYNGWQHESDHNVISFIRSFLQSGLQNIVCTDISTDGTLSGPNLSLYKKLIQNFPDMNIIASGGVSSMDDIRKLKGAGVHAVIVGKAIYEGRISLDELTQL